MIYLAFPGALSAWSRRTWGPADGPRESSWRAHP